ncbi:major facilitator superfamily domain-containing protein [Jimgerdemannia flammicorona]|uniref:Major facilitator superfamily domain-containing protein n=1 Tax=Jimgerdemannia flammicorona TaxID=994334 RepID=A0A433QSI8_9FUNG|nr:major facilitator superfamily domain-containing protein [Jimgerdemannia flammicorona]
MVSRTYQLFMIAREFQRGPMLGPAIAAYGFAVFLLLLLRLPETWRHNPLGPQPTLNLFAALALFRHMAMTLTVTFVGVTFGCYFLSSTTLSRTFSVQYGLGPAAVGLSYVAPAVGSLVGSRFGGWYSDYVVRKWKEVNKGEAPPEARFASVWVGCAVVPVGFLAYGWLVQKDTHFAWPLVAQFAIGFAMCTVFVSIGAYLVDSIKARPASATGKPLSTIFLHSTNASTSYFYSTGPHLSACQSLLRGLGSGTGALVAAQAETLSEGVLYSIVAGITAVSVGMLVVTARYGEKWRSAASVTV